MNKRSCSYIIALLALCFQAACGAAPTAAPAPPIAPPAIATPVEPTAVEPTAVVPTAVPPTAAPPVLAMEVGTTFSYFDGSLLVPVPAGPFTMGGGGSDNPVHTVYLSDFWIYTTEVTNRMYSLCVAVGKCSPPDAMDNPIFTDVRQGNRPLVGVNWQQASDYCAFAHGRLPTEAEWEKTARGPNGNTFPWGEDPPKCDLLNFGSCVFQTTNVGTYPKGKSYYGAFDLSGNVFEWVSDWYLTSYYGTAPTQDPLGPDIGSKRSVRSSSFNSDGYLTEVSRRFSAIPDEHRATLGFRCVVEDPTYFAPFCTQPLTLGKIPPGGTAVGETLKENCNTPVIVQSQLDCNRTNVWVDPNGGDISFSSGFDGCADGGLQVHGGKQMHLYTCFVGDNDPVKVCGICEHPLPSDVSCAPGYVQVGNKCVIKVGYQGQCPEGATYDPAQQCCTPPASMVNVYRLCAPGYYPIPDASGDLVGCVNYVAGNPICTGTKVAFKTGCGQPNQPCDPTLDPNCPPPPNNCPPGSTGPGCCTGPNCPPTGCLPAQTRIDTPLGPMPVAELQVGDSVWTIDAAGQRVAASILKVGRTPVPASYEVLHLVLADGRDLWASAGHPTADGRRLGDLSVGDTLDGALITVAERVPYGQPATYDLLPSGETGFYWANGIRLASTLAGP